MSTSTPTTVTASSTPSRKTPRVIIGDIHEDGRFLYPGTGAAHETGIGAAEGTKLNIPLTPGAGDDAFFEAWDRSRRTSMPRNPSS